MFILFFLVFTLIFTVFENILIAGISLLLVLLFLMIYQVISKKKILGKKNLLRILLSFVLAGVVFGVKEWRYYGMWNKDKGTRDKEQVTIFQVPHPSLPSPKSQFSTSLLVWTWIVDDVSSQGKYVFVYKWDEYLLYSKKEYTIGDQVWIVGNIKLGTRDEEKGTRYLTISSWTFAIPLFSWSFDFEKWMKMKGWKGTIYETNSIILRDEGQGTRNEEMDGIVSQQNWFRPQNLTHAVLGGRLPEWGPAYLTPEWGNKVKNPSLWIIKSMKKWIQEKVVQAYGKGKVAGLILGMLIGDKSQIPESEYQYFVNSGLVHLIAVSGGNILMIVVFLQFILFFIPFYIRLGLILLTIIGYSLICGLDSSVFRAVLMGGMSMVALFRGREVNIRRLLSISAIIMLIINPYFLAYDVGFLLSYSAIIGLIYFGTRDEGQVTRTSLPSPTSQFSKSRFSRFSRPIFWIQKIFQYVYKSYISPSIWASIGIFPIIIFFMGKINILGIVWNLFVLPIVPFVMIYGFISIRLYSLFGWERLLWVEKILVNYIYKISELLSQYGLYFSVTWLRFKYMVLLGCGVLFMLRMRRKDKKTD